MKTDGSPYLEPHHITRLADNGPDHPAKVIALCPNCHRKAHSSQDKLVFCPEEKAGPTGARRERPAIRLNGTYPTILMSPFDYYIMVDWSGAARRRRMRTDTIWIACGKIKAEKPKTVSPFSRTVATQLIQSLLEDQTNKGLHVLVCFDFAYGYPRDFPAALQTAMGKADATFPWLTVWQYLSDAIKDDEGTVPHRKSTNRCNRFDVANKINALLSLGPEASGPFWCASTEAAYLYIPHGTASVGSQILTGIPRLQNLRFDPKFAARSAVWPFETGWATKANWLPKTVSILHAEIYPSVREPKADLIKDRGQVRSMWEWARDLDYQDLLWFEFLARLNRSGIEEISQFN